MESEKKKQYKRRTINAWNDNIEINEDGNLKRFESATNGRYEWINSDGDERIHENAKGERTHLFLEYCSMRGVHSLTQHERFTIYQTSTTISIVFTSGKYGSISMLKICNSNDKNNTYDGSEGLK